MSESAPAGGGRTRTTLPPGLSRERLTSFANEAGLGYLRPPTVDRLVALTNSVITELDLGEMPEVDEERAATLLADLQEARLRFMEEDLPRLRDAHLRSSDPDLTARDSPYRGLAVIVSRFLVQWLRERPFGEWSLTTGVVVAETALQLHGFTAALAWAEDERSAPMGGGVCIWAVRAAQLPNDDPDALDHVVKALFGRWRQKIE